MRLAKLTLAGLNALDQDKFAGALGWIFEDSPWVMQEVWLERPFASLEALHRIAIHCLLTAPREKQLALLKAHPDLGTRARVSDASQEEQAGVGLDRPTAEELARLRSLNHAYRGRFGFPFLYAVKGSTKHEILNALEQRLQNTPEHEFQEALRQAYCIARFRLDDAVS